MAWSRTRCMEEAKTSVILWNSCRTRNEVTGPSSTPQKLGWKPAKKTSRYFSILCSRSEQLHLCSLQCIFFDWLWILVITFLNERNGMISSQSFKDLWIRWNTIEWRVRSFSRFFCRMETSSKAMGLICWTTHPTTISNIVQERPR